MKMQTFTDIDLSDPFFDTLKVGYREFEDWYTKKAKDGAKAYVKYDNNNKIIGFLYLKIELSPLDDIVPSRIAKKRLKIGTFKVNAHGTKFGERFIKKIMDNAIVENVDEIYVTIFAKHDKLISLLKRYGFNEEATKTTSNGVEMVLFKDMRILTGDICLDYPLLKTNGRRKFALSIYPKFHTRLFPDSILTTENYLLIRDVSETNSIHKIYICFMDLTGLDKGDLLSIYRTTDIQGKAYYRSVISSICVVEEVKTKTDFKNLEEFLRYTKPHSVFSDQELTKWYNYQKRIFVIKMTYNIALNKRVTNKQLQEDLNIKPQYWGFFKLDDTQFKGLLELGKVYENIIIN